MQDTPPQNPCHLELDEFLEGCRTHDDGWHEIKSQLDRLKYASERLFEESLRLRKSYSLAKPSSIPLETFSGSDDQLRLLAPREIEVLRLIAEGLSTKEIAGRLRISFKTAVCYRSRLLEKLQLHESASLVRLAIRTGLLSA